MDDTNWGKIFLDLVGLAINEKINDYVSAQESEDEALLNQLIENIMDYKKMITNMSKELSEYICDIEGAEDEEKVIEEVFELWCLAAICNDDKEWLKEMLQSELTDEQLDLCESYHGVLEEIDELLEMCSSDWNKTEGLIWASNQFHNTAITLYETCDDPDDDFDKNEICEKLLKATRKFRKKMIAVRNLLGELLSEAYEDDENL